MSIIIWTGNSISITRHTVPPSTQIKPSITNRTGPSRKAVHTISPTRDQLTTPSPIIKLIKRRTGLTHISTPIFTHSTASNKTRIICWDRYAMGTEDVGEDIAWEALETD